MQLVEMRPNAIFSVPGVYLRSAAQPTNWRLTPFRPISLDVVAACATTFSAYLFPPAEPGARLCDAPSRVAGKSAIRNGFRHAR
jgi:hypothetical protein